jgi:uncharacterized protein (TIGR03435 family)
MSKLQRRIYSALLRLHPESFRNQFARDMVRDCEDAIRERGFLALLGDAFFSLARQWKDRALTSPDLEPAVEGHPFLSGQYVTIDRGPSVTPFDLARASFLSALLVLTIGFAASVPNRHVIANTQSARVDHNGGIDTGGGSSHTASNPARREAPGAGGLLLAGNGGVPFHGRVRLVPGSGGVGWRLRARGGPGAIGTLAHAVRQLLLVTLILWLTSFFVFRSSGMARRVVLSIFGLLGIAASVALASVPVSSTHAQILHATAHPPSFEVATVKPVQPRPVPPPPLAGVPDNRPPAPRKFGIGKLGGQSTDRVQMNSSAQMLILFAYNLPFGSERTRILGGPDWLTSAQYEIQAKIDDSLFAAMQKMAPEQQREQVELMEQSLLADRFKLKVHFETREMPVYALVVAKDEPRLAPAKEGEVTSISSLHNEIAAKAISLDDFATSSLWTPIAGRLVVNQTELKGRFDFTLNWAQDEAASEPTQENAAAMSPIFAAIQQQLGLRLVPAKAPVEVIVIDHIEKPTEN